MEKDLLNAIKIENYVLVDNIIKNILKNGEDIPIKIFYMCYEDLTLMRVFIINNIFINEVHPKFNNTLFTLSCFHGKYLFVKKLIELGANIEHKTYYKNTGLYIACAKGHIDIVKLLLSNNVNTKNINDDNIMAIEIACKFENYDIFNLLCEHDEYDDKIFKKILNNAVKNNKLGLVKLFISNGLINRCKYEKTSNNYVKENKYPLLIPCKKGYYEIVEHLIPFYNMNQIIYKNYN